MLSIIVPVHNSEKYLAKCVNSILAQSYQNWELVLVENGSADHSLELCRNFAEQDPRIRVMVGDKTGVSAARNLGLKEAEGAYIGFVDADDYIEPDMYESLIASAEREHLDLVICGWIEERPDGTGKQETSCKERRYQNENNELMKDIMDQRQAGGFLWNKLFRKGYIQETYLDESMTLCEDLEFLFRNLSAKGCRAKRISGNYYHYVRYPDSASGSRNVMFQEDGNLRYGSVIEKLKTEVSDKAIRRILEEKRIENIINLIIFFRRDHLEPIYETGLYKSFGRYCGWKTLFRIRSLKLGLKYFYAVRQYKRYRRKKKERG